LLAALLAAACGASPTGVTPAPAVTASPVAPAPSAATGTPSGSAIVAPTSTPSTSLSTGWRYDLRCSEDDEACRLHLVDELDHDRPGWPVAVEGQCDPWDVATGPDGRAYVACTTPGDIVHAFDPSGAERSGWPVRLDHGVTDLFWHDFGLCFSGDVPSLAVAPDGTIYVATVGKVGHSGLVLEAFSPDGRPRPGWPRRFEDAEMPGFTIAPDGTVVAWWFQDSTGEMTCAARRSVFTSISPDGDTIDGWPIGSRGAASGPVIGEGGTLYYTSATGKVYAHDRAGRVRSGWPYRLPAPIAPELSPDGRLVFLFDDWDGDDPTWSVIALNSRGRDAGGWPVQRRGLLTAPTCDAPSMGWIPHAFAPDGTLYVAPDTGSGARITALDPRGRTAAGWPYRLPAGSWVVGLRLDADERLVASVLTGSGRDGPCGSNVTQRTVTLTPAGEPVR
jgi:outer membrane protein assembly factor BamB